MLTKLKRARPWVCAFTAAIMLAATPAAPAMLGILHWRAFAVCASAAMLLLLVSALLWANEDDTN